MKNKHPNKKLSHIDERGQINMVAVGHKPVTQRIARARGRVTMMQDTLNLIRVGNLKKGDIISTAMIAGIMGAKKTSELIPLCHPLPLSQITVDIAYSDEESAILIEAQAQTTGQTGVEMEALTAVSVAALTIYDMAKAVDRTMQIEAIRLVEKEAANQEMSFLNRQIQLSIRFFATLRDGVGKKQIEINLEEPATVNKLLEELVRNYPLLEAALNNAVVAINEEFAFAQDPLHDGDEVALFPPVSGGSENNPREYFAVTEANLSTEEILAKITGPETGGVATFVGQVRGITHTENNNLRTQHLFYEAYIPMAENKMRQIAQEIRGEFPLVHGIAIVQRVGQLEVGEITVLVACAAGHRNNGIFEAARYGIDRLKEIVPVWKKEVDEDKTSWVEGQYHPTPDDMNKQ